MSSPGTYAVAPSAARLTESLRDIGYDLPSAIADLVDNSVAAGASRIDILFETDYPEPRILIADDGTGMTANRIHEALRFGSRRKYAVGDLGRYGLGLKTASLSQCRTVTVVSRRPPSGPITVRQLDMDIIADFDEWLIIQPRTTDAVRQGRALLNEQMNTVVIWEHLDRLLPGRRDTGYARRRLDTWTARTRDRLAMVFHRFLDPASAAPLSISVNGEKVRAWDPFASSQPVTVELPRQTFEIGVGDDHGTVSLRRWVLPPRHLFSNPGEFDRAAGPLKWNRQQGLYIYRADRLVQWGGWAGLRAIDEHTKLARCALDFGTDLDTAFNINVAKMRVTIPTALRPMLERPVQELCQVAGDAYRSATPIPNRDRAHGTDRPVSGSPMDSDVGLALVSAAAQANQIDALRAIAAVLRDQDPSVAAALGLDTF